MSTVNNNLNSATVPMSPSFGGTGVANTGTFTVGGNTSFVGAHTFAGTITGDTTVTFPTSGTLQTTTGASGTVNSGTANQLGYYASSTNAISGFSTTSAAVLSSASGGTLAWLALTDGQVVIGSTAGSPAAGTITAGTGISVTNAGNSITIAATALGTGWANISGTTQTAAINTGYVIGSASQTTVTLPVTAALGSVVRIQGKGAGGWILAAGTGQTIQVGQTATTTAGSVTSAAAFDAIEVVCITANTTWATAFVLSSGVTVA